MPETDGALQEAARELLTALKAQPARSPDVNRAMQRLEDVLLSETVAFIDDPDEGA